MRRVLVTASRKWSNASIIHSALNQELQQFGSLIVVHGGADGGDTIADCWAWAMHHAGYNVRPEKHDPDYGLYGRKFAPLRRNEAMVALGAAICHAFPLEGGAGTRHCMSHAYAAGIPVVNHGFQPHTQQAKDYAEAYLSTTPKPTRECSL